MLQTLGLPTLVGDGVAGDVIGGQIRAGDLVGDHVAVDEYAAAGHDARLKLGQGGLVEGDQLRGMGEHGEPTGLSESTTEQLAVPPRISGP